MQGGSSWVDTPLSFSLLAAQSSGAVEEILDLENKRMADSLASKVTRLKSVSSSSVHLHLEPWGGVRGQEGTWKGFMPFPPHSRPCQCSPGPDFCWWLCV